MFAGGPMDHGGPIPMVSDFGALTPDSSFLNQPGGPGGGGGGPGGSASGGPPDHVMGAGGVGGGGGPRGGSPEFMNSGNFSEPQNMQNEGLVW